MYSYWGKIYNCTVPFLKDKCKIVSRFHGNGDLWNSEFREGYIPAQKAIIDSLDAAVIISRKGEFLNRFIQIAVVRLSIWEQEIVEFVAKVMMGSLGYSVVLQFIR